MEQDKKLTEPEYVYSRSGDKQRVVITGSQTKAITAMVIYILTQYNRLFDYISQLPGSSNTPIDDDNPLIIIEEKEKPTASILKYHHHIGVISEIEPVDEPLINQFANATPKGGALIFCDREPAQSIGKKERPGVTAVPYGLNLHSLENGKVVLISGSQQRFPIKLQGDQNLRNISAAKEILKKVGITSEQFYGALAGFGG